MHLVLVPDYLLGQRDCSAPPEQAEAVAVPREQRRGHGWSDALQGHQSFVETNHPDC